MTQPAKTHMTKASIEEASKQIELVTKACDIVSLSKMAALEQAVTLARGINALKRVFTAELVEEVFMPLQGNALGFLTDKDKDGGYSSIVVRNVWIQGSIWGLQPVNNELNIIAEKAYAAKNGLERKVREVTRGLVIRPGVPAVSQQGDKVALLPMRAKWTVDGQVFELIKDVSTIDGQKFDERYAIRVNAGMGPDAVIGKGMRKLYRDILQMITNGVAPIPDGDVTDTVGEIMTEKPNLGDLYRNNQGSTVEVPGTASTPTREPGQEG